MHEWALSDSVAAAAAAEAEKNNLNAVTRVVVVLGEVQNIAPGVFKEIFDEVKLQHPRTHNAEMVIENEPALFKCNRCASEFGMQRAAMTHEHLEDIHFVPEAAVVYAACPKCASKDFNILKGRGLYIKEITGE